MKEDMKEDLLPVFAAFCLVVFAPVGLIVAWWVLRRE